MEEAIILGANRAIRELQESGGIGYEKQFTAKVDSKDVTYSLPADVKSIVGLNATVTFNGDGVYFLTEPKRDFLDEDFFVAPVRKGEINVLFIAANNTNDGLLNKRAVGIYKFSSEICPTFSYNYPGYDGIVFCYAETSDTMGMGITLPRGWYAINSNTYAMTPFNIEDNPFVLESFDDCVDGNGRHEQMKVIIENFFTRKKNHSFTIKESNLGIEGAAVCYADVAKIPNDNNGAKAITACTAFSYDQSKHEIGYYNGVRPVESASASWKTTTPIDPKYLPGVCLPVVELSAETLMALLSGQQVMATEKEAAVFMAARDNIAPLVVRGNFNGAGFASVGAFVTDSSSGAQIFDTNIASNRLIAMFVDGGVQLHIQ